MRFLGALRLRLSVCVVSSVSCFGGVLLASPSEPWSLSTHLLEQFRLRRLSSVGLLGRLRAFLAIEAFLGIRTIKGPVRGLLPGGNHSVAQNPAIYPSVRHGGGGIDLGLPYPLERAVFLSPRTRAFRTAWKRIGRTERVV